MPNVSVYGIIIGPITEWWLTCHVVVNKNRILLSFPKLNSSVISCHKIWFTLEIYLSSWFGHKESEFNISGSNHKALGKGKSKFRIFIFTSVLCSLCPRVECGRVWKSSWCQENLILYHSLTRRPDLSILFTWLAVFEAFWSFEEKGDEEKSVQY